jgi:hypothetical protein
MATTDARTGFRLPWSSDQRSQTDDTTDESTADAETSTESVDAPSAEAAVDPLTGTATEGNDAMQETYAPEMPASEAPLSEPPASASHAAPAKRQNKFMADLTKAMQAAAESARDEAMARIQADAKANIEAIHERSATDAADLRRRADDDVAAVREWSKAEIARIREETDQRISARKGNLEFEIEEHAARIERQIEHVQGRVAGFESDMAVFFEKLLAEDDPSRFAAMAESLPEPPPFDLDELAASAWLNSPAHPLEPAASADPTEAEVEATSDSTPEPATTPEAEDVESIGWAEPAAVAPEPLDDATAHDETDPRLSALAMSADFAAAEAEAQVAADSSDGTEEIPTINDDALAARLAGLVPDGETGTNGTSDQHVTQVVVSGLVSVASIASFKRHLGRLHGVQSVGVSSGPEGEFVFAVSHAADIVLRDSVPSMPGFQARVTGGTDGTVEVTAHDPESEG